MTRRFSAPRPCVQVLLLVLLLGFLIPLSSSQFLSSYWHSEPGGRSILPGCELVGFTQEGVPSLEGGVEWINSGPITLEQLKGKIVLLDFWTYCCINCHHILPTLARLEEKFKNELVIIGVHSGKFDAERNSENIRRKVAEYRIKHPVVNDAEMKIWERFGVQSWPTIVLIAPDGKFYKSGSGELPFDVLNREIEKLAAAYKGRLNLKPIAIEPEMNKIRTAPCSFRARLWQTSPATACSSPTRGTTGSSRPIWVASRPWRSARRRGLCQRRFLHSAIQPAPGNVPCGRDPLRGRHRESRHPRH